MAKQKKKVIKRYPKRHRGRYRKRINNIYLSWQSRTGKYIARPITRKGKKQVLGRVIQQMGMASALEQWAKKQTRYRKRK